MKKSFILRLIIFLMFAPWVAYAQTSVTVLAGYGSWSMKSMKTWQEEYKNTFPVEAKTIQAFPSYWFFDASLTKRTDRWLRGLSVSNGSTGGRVYYSDYSGAIRFDQDLSFYALSGIVGRTMNKNVEKILITAALRPGIMLSKVSYEYEEEIGGDQMESVSNKFTSLNLIIQPSVSMMRKFGQIGIEILTGYQLAIVNGKMTYKDESKIPPGQNNVDYLILNENQSPVKADWSGFRLALGINYTFAK